MNTFWNFKSRVFVIFFFSQKTTHDSSCLGFFSPSPQSSRQQKWTGRIMELREHPQHCSLSSNQLLWEWGSAAWLGSAPPPLAHQGPELQWLWVVCEEQLWATQILLWEWHWYTREAGKAPLWWTFHHQLDGRWRGKKKSLLNSKQV